MKKTLFRIYDNPKYIDRYTIVLMQQSYYKQGTKMYQCLACNSYPFHPQGFGQHTECMLGNHLGTRISIEDVPEDVQTFIRQEFDMEYLLDDLVCMEYINKKQHNSNMSHNKVLKDSNE